MVFLTPIYLILFFNQLPIMVLKPIKVLYELFEIKANPLVILHQGNLICKLPPASKFKEPVLI